MEPTGVTDKANGAQVALQGDASLEWEDEFVGTEKGWGLIPNGPLQFR